MHHSLMNNHAKYNKHQHTWYIGSFGYYVKQIAQNDDNRSDNDDLKSAHIEVNLKGFSAGF